MLYLNESDHVKHLVLIYVNTFHKYFLKKDL